MRPALARFGASHRRWLAPRGHLPFNGERPDRAAHVKLQFPFIQLPLAFDAALLAEEVAAIDADAWRPHPQGFPGNSMLPLVAVDGDAANEAFAGRMQVTPELRRCPYLMQVLASLGATVGRTRLMRLAGQAEVTRHADQGYYWVERVRVHIPIVTQPTVRFECGDAAVNMQAGECWIFDTWRQHRVLNDASQSRIHLVCDTVGGTAFWELVARGRPHGAGVGDQAWRPQKVEAAAGPCDIPCESVNVPMVMTPWELTAHLGFLFGEALPHPNLGLLQHEAGRLLRTWKGLWAAHGEAHTAHGQYRAAFDAFIVAARGPGASVRLRNELPFLPVVEVMLGRTVVATSQAVAPDAGAQRAMGDNA